METTTTHPGSAIRVSGGPIRSVEVVLDASLTGRIRLTARADEDREVQAISVRSKLRRLVVKVPPRPAPNAPRPGLLARLFGRRSVVHGDLVGGTDDNGLPPPTLDLVLHVPYGCDVRLDLAGSTRATVGNVMGDLRLVASGSVVATVGTVLATRIDAAGDVEASIAETRGDLVIGLAGSARVDLARVGAGDMNLTACGGCRLTIKDGEIGEAAVDMSGAGTVTVDAIVTGDLTFDGSGAFEAGFARVAGNVVSAHSGSGTLKVGGRKR